MSQEESEVYIMRDEDEAEWVSPTPAGRVVREAVADATDLDADDIDDLDAYVDLGELRGVLDGEDGSVTFDVEGHEVTVDSAGNVQV